MRKILTLIVVIGMMTACEKEEETLDLYLHSDASVNGCVLNPRGEAFDCYEGQLSKQIILPFEKFYVLRFTSTSDFTMKYNRMDGNVYREITLYSTNKSITDTIYP